MAKPRRENRWGGRIKVFFGLVMLLILLAATAGALYVAYVFREAQKSVQSLDSLADYQPGGITQIFATDKDPRTGQPILLGEVYGKYREFVPVNKMGENVTQATIAIEDERFYEHSGVDVWAIGRAVYRNFANRRMSEGASTLTQQLTRNLILNDKRKTVSRKLNEILLSVEIEKSFSKEQILEMYLNEVYYGSHAYGVQAAAKVYFNKPAEKLTLAEAALLAGLPQRPIAFDPFRNLDAAVRRRNVVLTKMAQLKQAKPDDIKATLKEIKAAQTEKPKLAPEPDPARTNFRAPYFTNYVLRQLIAQYGQDAVYNNGFKVYTTLNYAMQKAAQDSIAGGVNRGKSQGITEAVLVSLEPRTGYIRAMVGGVDYDKEEFNNVTQGKRQPGSTFKPIVYAAAFETNRYGPYSSLPNRRQSINRYNPRNYDGKYSDEVTIRDAIKFSINIPAVRVTYSIGVGKVVDVARRMGITSELSPDLPLALGASAVSPLEMAGVYATFANGGNYARPMAIVRIIDAEGNSLQNNAPSVTKQVIPESVAANVSECLRAVVTEGTGKVVIGVPNAHGKTGTTSDRRDIWFAGYTPELSTIVWACGVKTEARKDKKTGKTRLFKVYKELDEGSFGGKYCGPIWAQFMTAALPIQQRHPETNRLAPEQTSPSDAQVRAKTGVSGPNVSQTDDSEAGPRPGEIEIPRARDGRELRERTAEEKAADERAADAERAAPRRDRAAPTPEPTGETPSPDVGEERPTRRRSEPEAPPVEERKVTVKLCPDSGKLATQWCPETVTRTIAPSLVPKAFCNRHKPKTGDG